MSTNGKSMALKSIPSAPASQVQLERYTQQSREAYEAMSAIWTERWTLAQAAEHLGKSKDELAIQFAIFGMQAMEALRTKGIYDNTLFLAMGKNREGYGPDMEVALEEARGQKGKEAAMRRKQNGLPLTRGNHDDLETANGIENRRSSATKSPERIRQLGELAPVSGSVQTIFHGQYGGQWASGRR